MSISPIRILTVDDHPLLREGIAALVNTEPDMKLVAEASNGEEAIEKFRSHRRRDDGFNLKRVFGTVEYVTGQIFAERSL
jgi:CheY-like chemotaxis protein